MLFSRQFILGFFTELLAILKIGKHAPTGIDAIFKKVLGMEKVDAGKSFKQMGGDSLSYVAMSLELEDYLGHIPKNWENLSVAELTGLAEGRAAA